MSQAQVVYKFSHMDDNESMYFSRELEKIKARSYDVKYPELMARQLLPVDNEVGPGLEVLTYRQYDQVGLARMIADYADDLPRADTYGQEFTSRIYSMGSSYGYSIQEIRAAAAGGKPLEQRKANAARKAVEELIERIARTGDSDLGLLGLLNQSGTNTYTVPTDGVGASALWADKTVAQILRDLHGMANKAPEATRGVERQDTMVLPLSSYHHISQTRLGDGSDTTILAHFLATNPYIKQVVPWYHLETAGANSTKRAVVYRKDPDALQLVIPQEFEQFPPQQKGLSAVVPCHARIGGVVCYYPLSITYADGF